MCHSDRVSEVGGGRIKVRRVKAGFFERDRLRSYVVMIDERPSGQVRRGKQIVIDVPPGHHEVRIKIDWSGSRTLPVDVEADQQVDLVAIPKGVQFAPVGDLASKDGWVTLVRE
jgi:hypothetical protein